MLCNYFDKAGEYVEILDNFSLSNPYRYCIYLSSVTLVSSLLTEPIGINIVSLRYACFWLVTSGLIAWIIENRYYEYLSELESNESIEVEHLAERYSHFKLNLNLIYLILGFFIVVFCF